MGFWLFIEKYVRNDDEYIPCSFLRHFVDFMTSPMREKTFDSRIFLLLVFQWKNYSIQWINDCLRGGGDIQLHSWIRLLIIKFDSIRWQVYNYENEWFSKFFFFVVLLFLEILFLWHLFWCWKQNFLFLLNFFLVRRLNNLPFYFSNIFICSVCSSNCVEKFIFNNKKKKRTKQQTRKSVLIDFFLSRSLIC